MKTMPIWMGRMLKCCREKGSTHTIIKIYKKFKTLRVIFIFWVDKYDIKFYNINIIYIFITL